MPHDTALNVSPHRELGVPTAAPAPQGPAARPAQFVPPSQRPHKPAGVVAWIIWIVVLAAAGAGGYWLYRHAKAAQATAGPAGKGGRSGGGDRAIPVLAAKARVGKMDIYLTGLGSVQALNTVTVRTRIDGAIDSIYFVEGQQVYAGDPLFQIDPRPYEVQLTQAQAQLAKDQSILDNARNDLKRNTEAGEAVPAITIDQEKALVAQAEAALKIDNGQIASAKLNLSYTMITAPLTGRIGLKMVDSGNMVHASDSAGLAVITQLRPIAVVFNLPEDDLPQIRGQMQPRSAAAVSHMLSPFFRKALQIPTLRVDAYDRNLKEKIATGRLLAVDSQIDLTTGTVRLKGIFLNDDDSLFPNQFVNARLLVNVLKGVVIIPTAAVQQSPKGEFVYVVKADKTVEMRPVTVGPSEGDDSVILSGVSGPKSQAQHTAETVLGLYLKGSLHSAADVAHLGEIKAIEGDLVVVDGVDKLQEGTKVTPKRATTNPTTQSASEARTANGGDPSRARDGGRQGGGKPGDGKLQEGSWQGGSSHEGPSRGGSSQGGSSQGGSSQGGSSQGGTRGDHPAAPAPSQGAQ